jgi:hypothetical protein
MPRPLAAFTPKPCCNDDRRARSPAALISCGSLALGTGPRAQGRPAAVRRAALPGAQLFPPARCAGASPWPSIARAHLPPTPTHPAHPSNPSFPARRAPNSGPVAVVGRKPSSPARWALVRPCPPQQCAARPPRARSRERCCARPPLLGASCTNRCAAMLHPTPISPLAEPVPPPASGLALRGRPVYS